MIAPRIAIPGKQNSRPGRGARLFRLLRRLAWVAGLAAFLALSLFLYPFWGFPIRSFGQGRPPLTPPWALECWVWEDDRNTAASTLELLEDYRRLDFPVRTILIDSPWSDRYNDFQVDTSRFPDPQGFFQDLEKKGIRVVLWMTSMVDRFSKDTRIRDSADWYRQAGDSGFLVGPETPLRWWKGEGALLDYSNPRAREWWQGLQKPLLEWGIDGWKLDGTCTFFSSRWAGIPLPFQSTSQGWWTTRTYMDHYYREEYRFGRSVNPEFVTLARSIDSPLPWAHPEGFAPVDAAPVAWVGDNRHSWEDGDHGLQRAIRCILDSARLGYAVIGSDIGGYHGKEPIPADLYIRWAQFSAFCGLFLNGGHGERRMSRRSPEEREIIRRFSWLHTELLPYIYTAVAEAHQGAGPFMRPVSRSSFAYYFGPELWVSPIYDSRQEWTLDLPEGNWRYLFDDRRLLEGGKPMRRTFPLAEYPVFVRDGAILPMNISRSYSGIGEESWSGYLTLNIYPRGKSSARVVHADGSGLLEVEVSEGNPLEIRLQGSGKPHRLRILVPSPPAAVTCDGQSLAAGKDWDYIPEQARLIITRKNPVSGNYRIRW